MMNPVASATIDSRVSSPHVSKGARSRCSIQEPRITYPKIINYIRDKRSPIPKSEAVSRVMSANRAKNTTPELLLRKALYQAGHRGYRINYRIKFRIPHSEFRIPSVRPDITFVSKKLAIFVHGCYWHRCPKCNYPLPKNNPEFWQAKFTRNTERDALKVRELQLLGWKVITVWECDLKNRFTATLNRISKALS